ncbi:hypothetical protein PVAND_017840 [Polypedilum vanderplanki]|uniref:Cytochrome P450 n=1 Tax=Polypedilum vanderplanki TaxID=319348 RepID=A0A9J6B8U2_POLVA|nr:hypothetical protein PVAND_017840 [Polypedilum vanderplanki]
MFPEVERKVYEEIMQNCPNNDIDMKTIRNLKYLECVMNESMRLFPINLTYVRKVEKDLKLDDNIILPRNSYAFIRTKDVHRDPTIWGDDANEFKPERFLPENIKKVHPFAFHPFVLGP